MTPYFFDPFLSFASSMTVLAINKASTSLLLEICGLFDIIGFHRIRDKDLLNWCCLQTIKPAFYLFPGFAAIDYVALFSEVAKTDFTRLSSSESDVTVTASEFWSSTSVAWSWACALYLRVAPKI